MCTRIGHGLDELNPLRKLEHGGLLPSQKGDDPFKGQPGTGFRLYIGTDPFAHNRIRHGNDSHGRHIRVTGDESFNFRGTDTLTPPVDHLFNATGDRDVALFIDFGHVSGSEKPVLGKGLFVFLWILIIAREDTGPFEDQFALCVWREFIPLSINDLVSIIRACGSPHSAAYGRQVIPGARDSRHAFCRPIPIVKRHS